jgi:hypothetical protein
MLSERLRAYLEAAVKEAERTTMQIARGRVLPGR